MTHIHHSETDDKTGITLKIVLDNSGSTESPLDCDESVIFAVLHRWRLNPAESHGLDSPEAIEEFAKTNPEWQEFPLFMYEHGSVLYRLSKSGNPFSCPWDSGRAGSIFLKTADFLGENPPRGKKGEIKYGKEFFPDIESAMFKAAEIICEEYTDWCNGNIYGYMIEDQNGDHLDSCWGFIGDPNDYVLQEGRAVLKYEVQKETKRRNDAEKAERKMQYEQNRRVKVFCQLSPF